MIEVHILDDHKMLTEGIIRMINKSEVAKITASYYDVESCREKIIHNIPDILLLDIALPDGNGIDFCLEINKMCPKMKILILSTFDELSIIRRCLHNGASGYMLKNASSEELITSIEKVHKGEIYIYKDLNNQIKAKEKEEVIWLTMREKEVLSLIADGHSNPEIAEKLFLSPLTIKGYRKDLLLKFGVKNSVTLIKLALEQKFL